MKKFILLIYLLTITRSQRAMEHEQHANNIPTEKSPLIYYNSNQRPHYSPTEQHMIMQTVVPEEIKPCCYDNYPCVVMGAAPATFIVSKALSIIITTIQTGDPMVALTSPISYIFCGVAAIAFSVGLMMRYTDERQRLAYEAHDYAVSQGLILPNQSLFDTAKNVKK